MIPLLSHSYFHPYSRVTRGISLPARFRRIAGSNRVGSSSAVKEVREAQRSSSDRRQQRRERPQDMALHLPGIHVPNCRAIVEAATSRYHPIILRFAGISSVGRMQSPRSTDRDGYKLVKENMARIDQWYIWTRVLCSTAAVSDNRPWPFGINL